MKHYCALAVAPLLFAFAAPTQAQSTERPAVATSEEVSEAAPTVAVETTSASTEASTSTEASKKWEFSTVTYLWGASVKGESAIGVLPTVDLDLHFNTILKHLKFAFMGAAEARHDRLVFLGDLMWTHLGASKGIGIRDPDFIDAELDLKTLAVTGLGGYRVIEDGPVIVDILAGGRINNSTTDLKLTGPNRELSADISETWIDPVIATRMHVPLAGKFSMSLYGDIAGILWGSDFSWQGVATVDYQISRKMRLGVGWRYFKVDYDTEGFLYDVAQTGPFLGLRYTF